VRERVRDSERESGCEREKKGGERDKERNLTILV